MTPRSTGELLTFARDELMRRIAAAQKRIWLVSPFLTAGIGKRVAQAGSDSSAQDKRLLTALVPGSVQAGVLEPEALGLLREKGFEIASIANLHAKLSLVDSGWGMVGSGNLTDAGLGSPNRSNVELGAILSPTQIATAESLFAQWWAKAAAVSPDVIERFAAMPQIHQRNTGASDFGPMLEITHVGALEHVLRENPATANSRGYWIKSNYHRHDDEAWWHRGWISDRRQAPYEVGDLIVLYLAARDGGPASCPAVVRAITRSRFDREWVVGHRDAAAAERWPYVTETSIVAEVPVSSGVSLSVVGKSGQSVQQGYCSISRGQFEQIAHAMQA